MMTPEDQAFYDKYMRLADMAQDNQKAQEYRDIAETAWRNQQTTDRLAQTMGFEGYYDPKYADKRYTGGRREGQFVPGVDRMANNPYIQALEAAGTERPVGLQYDDPDMLNEILPGEPGVDLRPYAGMESGIDYDAMGLAPDPENDLLYGEPGFGAQKIKPKMKPSPGDFYDYPDERFLPAPWSPTIDPYEGIYESPLTDTLYNEELIDATPERPLHSRHEFLPRDTVGITRMGGGMNAFPKQSWWEWITGQEPSMDITEDLKEEIDYSKYPKGRLRLYGN